MAAYNRYELNDIKDAAYKVSDARYTLQAVADSMAAEGRWDGHADILRAVAALAEITDEGALTHFLRTL